MKRGMQIMQMPDAAPNFERLERVHACDGGMCIRVLCEARRVRASCKYGSSTGKPARLPL